jgi:hypothetical protein
MRNVQLIKKYIRIIAKKKIDSHDMKQTDSSIISQECVRAYLSIHDCLAIFHLILTKIDCITLKIRSKADFKSKSQNI